MVQRKVQYTKVRGMTDYFHMAIPATIRHLHPDHPTGTLRGTMKTSDPDEAERLGRKQKFTFGDLPTER